VSFTVIDFGTNQKPIYNFPVVLNNNLHPSLYRFKVIAHYGSNFSSKNDHFVFLSQPLGAKGQRMLFILDLLESS